MKPRRVKHSTEPQEAHKQTPTFLLELPLHVTQAQAKHLKAHLEVCRQLYNALLGEAMKCLRHMQADPAWAVARTIPRTQKQARAQAFAALRKQYGFSEYALHQAAKDLRPNWMAKHVDSLMAQALASRAYQAVNRVALGLAKKVRFKSQGRGLDSVEGKWNKSGLRFYLPEPTKGNQGVLFWNGDHIPAIIDWNDPVVVHGLHHRVKYCRLVRRWASSVQAEGADQYGFQYAVQLVLEGRPYQKPKNAPGQGIVGIDLGPSTVAIVSNQGPARLLLLAEELVPDAKRRKRLHRKLDRQRRAANQDHYDEQGRIKPRRQRPRSWKESYGYQTTRHQLSVAERELAAHRRSLHGRLANEIVRQGHDIRIEKLSYFGWQQQFGRSVSLRAPGRFVDALKCSVGRTDTALLHEISTQQSKLSQLCHACGSYTRKPLAQRYHCCPQCGLGHNTLIQRDLYSAWLLTQIDPIVYTFPSRGQLHERWIGTEAFLLAALVAVSERARERHLPRSFGIPKVGVRRPEGFARLSSEPESQ